MSEETIYSDENVNITTARVMFGSTTYALRNITSVKTTFTTPRIGCAIMLLVVGGVLVFAAFGFIQSAGVETGIPGLVFSICMVIAGILWLLRAKKTYHIAIATSAGEHRALSSKDEGYIDKIVESVNDAIVRQQ